MCRAVRCRRCGKQTWSGCGAHVEQVLGHLPVDERCACAPEPRRSLWQVLRGR